ncbi:MAG: Zn-binding domain-containing protein [Nostoc sp.]|uniref:DNA methyltransferase n=1 Tax=Nostoc sp. TaxID=1180 RepID=UPI002FF8ADB4
MSVARITLAGVQIEGNLLAADITAELLASNVKGQAPEDFGFTKTDKLADEIAIAWGDAKAYWAAFQRQLDRLDADEAATSVTRELWAVPLLRSLGYNPVYTAKAEIVEGQTYAISHRAELGENKPPIHIIGCRIKVDHRPPSGTPRLSAHALVQEYLNKTEHLWAIATNGFRWRLLRDSSLMTRLTYIEFDLEQILNGENFAEFGLFYRLFHRSRLPEGMDDADKCLLEFYHQEALQQGGRVRDRLRDGVEKALIQLGTGFLQHPQNEHLRQKFFDNYELVYYRQLLRLIYRLLFLMVAESRNLLIIGDDVEKARIYQEYYSIERLRELAERPRWRREGFQDLWQGLRVTFLLFDENWRGQYLGLSPLNGDLFGSTTLPDLDDCAIDNHDLLVAIRELSLYQEKGQLRRVNYAALDVEELGSVYESLLDFHPEVTPKNHEFKLVFGSDRKTTGSYYTPPQLVGQLIKTALEPVIEEKVRSCASAHLDSDALKRNYEQALLSLKIVDPACGSGHFLLAAARRVGKELAKIRTGEAEPGSEPLKLAIRDVIQNCIYGVDLNPLAVDLCKVALWIEGFSRGFPLNFLDHRIKCGNSLVGVMDLSCLNEGIPLDSPDCPLKEDVSQKIKMSQEKLAKCLAATKLILSDTFCQNDLNKTSWYSENWLQFTLENAHNAFDQACDRWRRLYKDAVEQLDKARDSTSRYTRGYATQEERDIAKAQEKEALRQIDLLVGQVQSRSNNQFEFYPYRYFAAEGFLPGFNFPRLPVRAFIPTEESGEFISRLRSVALREFAPGNVIYYEGSKFMVAKTKMPVSGADYQRANVCFKCGYFHEGTASNGDTCENCGVKLADSNNNKALLTRLLSMETAIAWRRERITCDEEERLKYGYNITTHFRYDQQKRQSATVQTADGTELLRLTYGATADIWHINRGLNKKKSEERGFKLDIKTGIWGDAKNDSAKDSIHTDVNLMVKNTCNILVVEPLSVPTDEREAFIATLQYVLETAIQAVYKLEADELDSERLGDGKYLLFWEAAEGGVGVLSQLLEKPDAFQKIADAALDICHFKETKDSCVQACYECLLSYRNQFDHALINRYLIKPLLDELEKSTVQIEGISRDEQYQQLLQQTDPNSEFERVVLEEIYQRGYKLPDAAQELIPEANCKPDFLYKEDGIAVFCDGSVHDSPDKRQQDQIERDNLKYNTSYHILVLRHDEDWRIEVTKLASL